MRKRAFTLVELLVVIATIGILVALLLPAVQAAREAARRMQCGNNLKQLALAMQNYESAHKTFPSSYFKGGYGGTEVSTSWMTGILPFIEEAPLFDRIRHGQAVGSAENLAVFQTVVPAFRCPSDGISPNTGRMVGPYIGACCGDDQWWVESQTAYTNYKACMGSNFGVGDFIQSSPRGRNANNTDGFNHGNGIIFRNWIVPLDTRLRHITDGTSKTFAVGEAVAWWCGWSEWGWSNGSTATCGIPLNYRKGLLDLHTVWDDYSRNFGYHSMHDGGGQFAMCDGSVHFISDEIDFTVYRALATLSSDEQVSVP